MVKQIKLPKTGETAITQLLTMSHLQAALDLHEATRAALPSFHKTFVLPQEPAYFERFLSGKEGAMLGVTIGDKLIAQLVLMGPLSLEDAILRKAISRNEIAFNHIGQLDDLVAVKSMTVHPDYRGNELSQYLLSGALDLPLLKNTDHVFAQISVENNRSWELFLRNGFGIVAAANDPSDQKPRFILQKPAEGFVLNLSASADEVDPVADFAAIERLTQIQGLVGHVDEFASSAGALRLAFSISENLGDELPRLTGEA